MSLKISGFHKISLSILFMKKDSVTVLCWEGLKIGEARVYLLSKSEVRNIQIMWLLSFLGKGRVYRGSVECLKYMHICIFWFQKVVCEHEIGNIFCACQDPENLNFFAYITKDRETSKHYCHVFSVSRTVSSSRGFSRLVVKWPRCLSWNT